MIRSILDLTREEIENLRLTKRATLYHDVCKALACGEKQEEIAEKFNIDDRTVRNIKRQNCAECGNSKGRPHKE